MIIYVETNFVLELVFLQSEHVECTRLLDMAAGKDIELAIPAYSFAEPYEKLIRRSRDRKELSLQLRKELAELSRSASFTDDAKRYADLAELLIASSAQEYERLSTGVSRLLDIATVIPTDSGVLRAALTAQRELGLGPQDSIVYAAVRQQMGTDSTERCFINKNTRDFFEPRIQAEFVALRCPVIPRFSDGLDYAKASLDRRAGALPSPASPDGGAAD